MTNSQLFKDYLAFFREQGMSGKDIMKGWRKRTKNERLKVFSEIRHDFCKKYGFDENMTDAEISVELLMRGDK